MAKQLRITVDDYVADWLEARSIEATKSDFIEHGIREHYGIGVSKSEKCGNGLQGAIELFRDMIEIRGQMEAKELIGIAALMGITRSTLRRAKALMNIKSKKIGFGPDSKWYWSKDK